MGRKTNNPPKTIESTTPKIKPDYKALIQQFIEEKIENRYLEISEFADRNSISADYFGQLTRKDPKVWEQILTESRKRYHFASAEVDQALEKRAKQGDANAIKLFYQKMEGWGEPVSAGNITIIIPNMLVSMDQRSTEDRVIDIKGGKANVVIEEGETNLLNRDPV